MRIDTWRWPSAFALALLLHLPLFGTGSAAWRDGAQNAAGSARGAGRDAVSIYELHFSAPAPRVQPPAESEQRSEPAPAVESIMREAGGGGRGGYYASLRAHLQRYRRPIQAQTAGARTVIVRFRVDGEGRVSAIGLQRSSGDPLLDAEALDLLRRSAPVPPPPRQIAMNLVVPIEFE
ncbi:MAG: TonB family protein [Sinimarinibacterium sp.]